MQTRVYSATAAALILAAAGLTACKPEAEAPKTEAPVAAGQGPIEAQPSAAPTTQSVVGTNQLDMYVSDGRVQNWQGIGTRDGNRLISNATNGFLMFGPKVAFDAGTYDVTIHGGGLKIGTDNSITFDVTSNEGQQVYARKVLDQTAQVEAGSPLTTFSVTLPQPVTDLEVRAYVTSGSEVTLTRYEVKPSASP